jgi:hypothetical protein
MTAVNGDLTQHAGTVHESAPLALRKVLPQIRQPNIGPIALE